MKTTKILSFLAVLLFSLSFVVANVFAQTPCPTGTSTDNVECQIGTIKLPFSVPNIGLNDLVSTISTILLAVIVIFFVFRIIIAGYKWVNNDAQDKSKKEAIKGITNGVIGIVIAFSAYFVVLFIQGFFHLNPSEQLLNCANDFLINGDYSKNLQADSLNNAASSFRNCMKLAGKEGILQDPNKYKAFTSGMMNNCYSKYYQVNPGVVILDNEGLKKCFVDQINSL